MHIHTRWQLLYYKCTQNNALAIQIKGCKNDFDILQNNPNYLQFTDILNM